MGNYGGNEDFYPPDKDLAGTARKDGTMSEVSSPYADEAEDVTRSPFADEAELASNDGAAWDTLAAWDTFAAQAGDTPRNAFAEPLDQDMDLDQWATQTSGGHELFHDTSDGLGQTGEATRSLSTGPVGAWDDIAQSPFADPISMPADVSQGQATVQAGDGAAAWDTFAAQAGDALQSPFADPIGMADQSAAGDPTDLLQSPFVDREADDAFLAARTKERAAELSALRFEGEKDLYLKGQDFGDDYLGREGYQRDARLTAHDPRMQARLQDKGSGFADATSQLSPTLNSGNKGITTEAKTGAKAGLTEYAKQAADLTKESLAGHASDHAATLAQEVVAKGLGAAMGAAVGGLDSVITKAAAKIVATATGNKKKRVPGVDYRPHEFPAPETANHMAGRLAKEYVPKAATVAAGVIPVVGTGVKIASAVKAGQREKRSEKLAASSVAEGRDDAQIALQEGLAKGHKQAKIDRGIGAAASAVGDIATVVTLGGAAPAVHAATQGLKAAKTVGTVAAKAAANMAETATSRESELRARAHLPERPQGMANEDYQALVDKANESLIGLSAESVERAKAQLDYLSEGQMTLGKELYTNKGAQNPESKPIKRLVDGAVPDDVERTAGDKILRRNKPAAEARTKATYSGATKATNRALGGASGAGGGSGEAVEEPNLKPSQVARLAEQERARLRQRERMGAAPAWDMDADKEAKKQRKAAAKAGDKAAATETGNTVTFGTGPTAPPAPRPDGSGQPTFLDAQEATQVTGGSNTLKDALKNQKKSKLLD